MFQPGKLTNMAEASAASPMPEITPDIKPCIEELLQARVDGGANEPRDIMKIIGKYSPPEGMKYGDLLRVTRIVQELIPCNIIPNARAFAEKHGLTINL